MKQSHFFILIIGLISTTLLATQLQVKNILPTHVVVKKGKPNDSIIKKNNSKPSTSYLKAIQHLKDYEGFRAKIYIDVNGSRTIGYGHHLLAGETYKNISSQLASKILKKDLDTRIQYIKAKYDIKGDTLLAFALFSFNCGTGTLAKAVNNGIFTEPTKLLKYCHYKTYDSLGNAIWHTSHKLLKRREYELSLITKKH